MARCENFPTHSVQTHSVGDQQSRVPTKKKCSAIGAREQSVPEGLVHEQTLSGGLYDTVDCVLAARTSGGRGARHKGGCSRSS